ncbi:MAG: hypothetical protein Fues2KO_10310 [Fuerstiella sp.]
MAALARPDFTSFGCLLLFVAIYVWGLGTIGHWIGIWVSPAVETAALWLGRVAAVGLTIPFVLSVSRYLSQQRRLAQADVKSQLVQEIHVTNPRVIEVAMIGNIGPNLAIELSDESVLYLQGQWLLNESIFRAPVPKNDEGDDRLNGLPDPHSFPSAEFTLTRLPHSGEVLRIDVQGEYQPPGPAVDALKKHYRFQPSEIFSGPITAIGDLMQREHARRTAVIRTD